MPAVQLNRPAGPCHRPAGGTERVAARPRDASLLLASRTRPHGRVDALRDQRQGFDDPAAGVVQDRTQCAHRALGLGSRGGEGSALLGGQAGAPAPEIVELLGAERIRTIRSAIWSFTGRYRRCPRSGPSRLRACSSTNTCA